MKKILLGLMIVILIPFTSTHALTTTETQQLIQTLIQQIASLQAQIQVLISQGASATSQKPSFIELNSNDNPGLPSGSASAAVFNVGDSVKAISTLNVRSASGQGTSILTQVSAGSIGKLLAGPNIAPDNSKWWQIGWNNGVNGWSSQDFLTKSTTVSTSQASAGISVDIKANGNDGPINIPSGASAMLWWTTSSPMLGFCSLWGNDKSIGAVNPSGQQTTGNLTQSTTFRITCINSSGVGPTTIQDSVTVNVNGQPNVQNGAAPTISSVNPTSANVGGMVNIYGSNFDNGTFIGIDGANGQSILPPEINLISPNTIGFVVPPRMSVGQHTLGVAEMAGPWSLSSGVSFTVTSSNSATPTFLLAPSLTVTSTQSSCPAGIYGGTESLVWNSVSGAAQYQVFKNGNLLTTISGNTYIDGNITPGTNYSYSVVAINGYNSSPNSNAVNIQSAPACPSSNMSGISLGQQRINAWLAPAVNWSQVSASALTPIYQQAIRAQGATTYLDYSTGAVTTIPAGAVPSPNFAIQGKFLRGEPTSESERAYVGYNNSSNIGVYYNIASDGTVTPKTNTSGLTTGNTLTFTANGSSGSITVTSGTKVDLHWNANNVQGCYGGGWSGQAGQTNIGGSGDAYVSPTQTTSYTVTCITVDNNTINSTVTVNVSTNPTATVGTPPVVTLNPNPTSIVAGQSSTLYPGVTDPTGIASCTLNGQTLPSPFGNQVVSPNQTTTYTLTCTNTGGLSSSANTTITVTPISTTPPAPTVNVYASPTAIIQGQSTSVSFSSINATSCTGNLIGGTSINGYVPAIYPTVTTTYTITCTGAGGSTSNSVTITVTPPTSNGGSGGGGFIPVSSNATQSNLASVQAGFNALLQAFQDFLKTNPQ